MNSYITHDVILKSLRRNFKSIEFDEEDVLNWCQEVETLYVADPNAMVKYLEIPLNVTNTRRVKIPTNNFKLLDVYAPAEYNYQGRSNRQRRVNFREQARYIVLDNDYDHDRVMINYIGTPLDDDTCLPLINADHQPACETFCKINAFEEHSAFNKISVNLYHDWKQRFDGMIQGVKGGVRGWSRDKFAKMTIIMGDKLPRIGFMTLAHREVFDNFKQS